MSETGDWLDRYADALGVARLSEGERADLLDLAREVAHATERANAPLATYLAGRAALGGPAALAPARACFE